jgi:murein DD-endopeptidase MepM/ murein hydrolase activator NlpD
MSLFAAGCGSSPTSPGTSEVCEGFTAWQTSPYVLPYSVGSSFFLSAGNCQQKVGGHNGVKKFGYDFDMAIGTPVRAARAGVVLHTEQSHFDLPEISETGNYVVVLHDDGTNSLYGHLTHDGVAVAVGERIQPGAVLGYSGNTGNTGTSPHLHYSVQSCDPVTLGTAACPTLPITFRNTDANATGLQAGRFYPAYPY